MTPSFSPLNLLRDTVRFLHGHATSPEDRVRLDQFDERIARRAALDEYRAEHHPHDPALLMVGVREEYVLLCDLSEMLAHFRSGGAAGRGD